MALLIHENGYPAESGALRRMNISMNSQVEQYSPTIPDSDGLRSVE